VDREQALAQLPETYAVALRLLDAGHEAADIADHLGLPPESMRSLLQVAEAKLARLSREAVLSET
jgi:DNA-directed RNA polymerase specialized sigma24 family protein